MPRKKKSVDEAVEAPATVETVNTVGSELAKAIIAGIEEARPKRITIANRKARTPWSPPPGVKKLTLKRKVYQHGLLIPTTRATNEEIDLLNKIKPGTYCDGWVNVIRRKDKGLNINYPIKTASQKLKLISSFGIRNLVELLQRIVDEGNNPTQYKTAEELD